VQPGGINDQAFRSFTITVEDEAETKRFFSALGFREGKTVVIKGERFAERNGRARA
jgi:hypothetical protein